MTKQLGSIAPKAIQLMGVGDAKVELVLPNLLNLPRFGREMVVPTMNLRPAGSAVNFSLCAASLGFNTGFAGRLAVDRFGELVLQAFRRVGVNTQWLRLVEEETTGITVTFVRPDGERAFVTYQGTNSTLTLDDVHAVCDASPPPRWLHLAGYHLLTKFRGKPAAILLETARERGITTSLDTGWDPGNWSSSTITDLKDVLQFVDIFFPNTLEVRAITGETSPRKGALQLLEMGATTVVVKMGKEGCLLVTQKDQQKFPAFTIDVTDTTAAGDAFDAGFVASMLSGTTLARAAVFANAVAALRVSRSPSQSLFPSLQETTAFLMRKRPLDV